MTHRRRLAFLPPLIALAALLPALAACHQSGEAPLTPAALAAVSPGADVPREALARAIDNLFADPHAGETRALLVLHHGRVVAERYGTGYGPQTRLVGWSMSKSVTGVLIGLLVSDGRLRLDQPVPIPLWQRPGDPRGEITLRQLLQMRAGLAHREEADTVRMLFLDGRDDMAAYAEAQPLEAAPGAHWEYSTATSVILGDLAARVLSEHDDPDSRRQAVSDYLRTRLFDPVGMASAVAEYDSRGTLVGGSLIHATARDWARFGEFLRNDGSVAGAQIVPRDWIRFMTSAAPHNPGYGAQIWLNRPQPDGQEVLFPGQAPDDVFACVGHLGQYVVVSPGQGVTLVRLGKTDEADRAAVRGHLAEILSLFGNPAS